MNIWADLASLFDRTFNAEDWLSILPDLFHTSYAENMAFHSPTMKAVYKRHMPRVEEALRNRQTDFMLWEMWQSMAQVTGKRILDFFPQFPDLPPRTIQVWPPELVVSWMLEEARVFNNYSKLIELKWPQWPSIQSGLDRFAPINTYPANASNNAFSTQKDRYWNNDISPLLEACLQTKNFNKANEIYWDISSRPAFEREARLAVEMAKAHKYEFPINYNPKKEPKTLEEPPVITNDPIAGAQILVRDRINSLKGFRSGFLHMMIIDPSVTDNINRNRLSTQIQGILSRDKLPEYYISTRIMKPDDPIAVELINREGLSDDRFTWGFLDNDAGDAKYYHGGNSLPTLDKIKDLLDFMNRKSRTAIYRDFAVDNLESVLAKQLLLMELERVGNIKMRNAKINSDDNLMDESADIEIWGEYINIANSIFPEILQRPDTMFSLLGSNSMYSLTSLSEKPIKKSRLLQQFAMRNIASIESALQDRPHARHLWELWGTLSPYVTNRSLPSFLATLTPVPDLPDFPPVFLYPDLIKNYKSLEDWRSIIALVEPIWESYERMIEAEVNIKNRLTRQLSEQYITPLCEAYTKIGQEQKAEKIRADWKKAEGWSR